MDVEKGVEVRPHHYIRFILSDGPVGINGRLKSGDELLEVGSVPCYNIRQFFNVLKWDYVIYIIYHIPSIFMLI